MNKEEYLKAKKALEDADGSVVDAIIAIEETVNSGDKKRAFGERGEALFTSLKSLVKKGNVAKILVKKDGISRFGHLYTFRAVVLLNPDESLAELFVKRRLKFFKHFLLEGVRLLGFFFLCHIDTICMNKKV